MITRKDNPYCSSCDDPCKSPCGPASYKCDFDITASPYDPSMWNVMWCGKLHKVKIPTIAETDTTLSTNYSNAVLTYKAERHEDIITGEQLGQLIRMEDLRDTNCDYTTDSMCYEIIYHKYGECGDGCMSPENEWATFSIDNEGALRDQIRYVRGANIFGCPVFLDVPPNLNEYWFAGWRTDTQQFGYYQAEKVQELPKDSKGNYVVMSRYKDNKRPVVGIIPWQCMLENIFENLGVDVTGVWREVQGTPGLSAKFNQINGDWQINWTDWNDIGPNPVHRAGYGQITGKVNWDVSFNADTGTIKYVIHNVYYDKVTWTVDEGVTVSSNPTMTLKSVAIPGGAEQQIGSPLTFGRSNVSQTLNATVPCNQTVIVGPNDVVGPFDFVHIYVDWVVDDEGYMGIQFASKLSGWKECTPGDF